MSYNGWYDIFKLLIPGTGDLFGEDICNKGNNIRRSNGDVKALIHCEVLYLSRENMKDVIRFYADFSEVFTRMLHLSFDLSSNKIVSCFLFFSKN